MSRDIEDLVPEFRMEVERLLEACVKDGFTMKPFFTLRTPAEQARLWRQSRTAEEIGAAITTLQDASATFLAGVIEQVGPQAGKRVTNALPGQSWHQWGEAVDCFWLVDRKAEWSSARKVELADGNKINGYHLYAQIAKQRNLEPGGLWSKLKDWPHVQLRAESSPTRIFAWNEIDARMRERFT